MSSKEKILRVSLELFYRKGYQATSIDEILEQAGVCKSNFYYHFKSKEDLGIAVLAQRSEDLNTLTSRTLCNFALTPKARLLRFLDVIADTQDKREKGGCPFGNLVAEMAEHSERFRCQLSDMFGGMTQTISSLVAEGQECGEIRRDIVSEDLAALIVQTIQGMQLLTKCHKSVESLARGARVLVRLIEVV